MSPSPHDRLFKQLIQADVLAFLSLFFPLLARGLGGAAVEWLDKEAFPDLLQGERRESDLLAALGPPDHRLLLLIELEDREGRRRRGDGIGERIFVYYSLLRARYRLPIFPVVVYLLRASRGRGRRRHAHRVLEKEVASVAWEVVGLPRLSAAEALARGGAMAGAFGALMDPGGWRPSEHKVACLDVIAAADASQALKYVAVNCVETYIPLDAEEERAFDALLAKECHMRAEEIHETWADRMMAKGREEGREQERVTSRRETVGRLLRLKFGELPEESRARLDALDTVEALDEVIEGVLFATSLSELGLQDP